MLPKCRTKQTFSVKFYISTDFNDIVHHHFGLIFLLNPTLEQKEKCLFFHQNHLKLTCFQQNIIYSNIKYCEYNQDIISKFYTLLFSL